MDTNKIKDTCHQSTDFKPSVLSFILMFLGYIKTLFLYIHGILLIVVQVNKWHAIAVMAACLPLPTS